MSKKIIITLFAIGISIITHQHSFAGADKFGYIEGTVLSWDEQNVKLATENGKHVSVKRSAIPNYYPLSEGSKVVAYFSQKEFLAAASKKRR